jgi:ribosomal protein S27AE
MANEKAKARVSLRKSPCERCGHHKSRHHCLGKCKTLLSLCAISGRTLKSAHHG